MSRPVDFGDVVAELQARPRDVAEAFAPGGAVDGQRYWALCPWRADTRIGSFYVNIAGPYCGRWMDHATGEHGDMLDLVQAAIGGDRRAAFDEACRFLGLAEETPEQRALRKRQLERLAEGRRRDAERAEKEAARKRAAAHHLWLGCREVLENTPVAHYLAGRGIGLRRLWRTPHAIRYHPRLAYRHVDPTTGEITEGEWPAMVTAIHGPHVDGQPAAFWGAHRTWLAQGPGGHWGKAPVPKPKKVLGSVGGGYIRLWTGCGPRGGPGEPLAKARPGSRLYITEGIENGLSVAVLMPHERVAAGVSLGNLAEMVLPPAITRIVLVRDNDRDPKVARIAEKAIARWMGEGRAVGMWMNRRWGKDINDALCLALETEEGVA